MKQKWLFQLNIVMPINTLLPVKLESFCFHSSFSSYLYTSVWPLTQYNDYILSPSHTLSIKNKPRGQNPFMERAGNFLSHFMGNRVFGQSHSFYNVTSDTLMIFAISLNLVMKAGIWSVVSYLIRHLRGSTWSSVNVKCTTCTGINNFIDIAA